MSNRMVGFSQRESLGSVCIHPEHITCGARKALEGEGTVMKGLQLAQELRLSFLKGLK